MSARLTPLLLGLVVLSACSDAAGSAGRGSADAPRASTSSPATPSDTPAESAAADTAAVGRVRLVTDAGEVVVRLRESPAARDLVSMLPLTLDLEGHGGTEAIAYLPRELETRDSPGGTPAVGELMYYTPWGNLVLYVAEGGVPSDALVSLGTVEPGGAPLTDLAGGVRLERVP